MCCSKQLGEKNFILGKMDFIKINGTTTLKDILPKKQMGELNVDGEYQGTKLKLINTKFGDSIVASLGNQFSVYLLKRATTAIRDDSTLLPSLNQIVEEQNLFIRYLGGKNNKFEFLVKEQN
ncbi:uncharacterized protein LOC106693966 [Microplitis demolitor]|uniref:uncharacterized protein LOC106693966 n=1 Tax=Microplitis demolitor TaxID=69319 RepID=UPI0006D51BDB|nr:uncharacterized protein LOC106693966 [Microplitis demolitor]